MDEQEEEPRMKPHAFVAMPFAVVEGSRLDRLLISEGRLIEIVDRILSRLGDDRPYSKNIRMKKEVTV